MAKAANLKRQTRDIKKHGFDLTNGSRKVAAVFESLSPRQDLYSFACYANSLVQRSYAISPMVFYDDISICPIEMHFPVFHMQYLFGYDGVLICNTISAMLKSEKSQRADKIFYFIGMEHEYNNINMEPIAEKLNGCGATIVAASELYRDELESVGVNVCRPTVAEFDIQKLLETHDNEG